MTYACRWDAALRARLAKRDLTGHVIHDDPDVDPVERPTTPTREEDTADTTWEAIWKLHRREVLTWKDNETEAQNIILERLSSKVWPRDYVRLSAKALYDSVSRSRRETASAPYLDALRQFQSLRLNITVEAYCDAFLTAYQNVTTAAENLSATDETPTDRSIPEATAAALFLVGTLLVPWLSSWRSHKALDSADKPIPLQTMVSSLRTAATNHHISRQHTTPASAATSTPTLNPEARCRLCQHHHRNKHCYKQNPDLAHARFGDKWRYGKNKTEDKGKGKAAANVDDDESFDDDDKEFREYLDSLFDEKTGRRKESDGIAATGSSSKLNKFSAIYDTGASHHFIPVRSMFDNLSKRHQPFHFDQAVGISSLKQQGTARVKYGNHTLILHDALYSPKSSSGIISAGRLERLANIFPDYKNKMLIKHTNGKSDESIARLSLHNDVYYIRPFYSGKLNTTITAAPGVARIPTTDSTQHWHQRLGHIGQQILKRTKDLTLGLKGIDTSELKTCETCHLSKAQRFVSREPRPTPNHPLDEVFIDTVGKLVPSIENMQYATIITDAKTRMRWVLTTTTKDQIAPSLVKWVQSMHHQYDKRVRTIFRDGGSEFIKIKQFCEQQGIRPDTSAPYTPEQNGPSEAANKVILRVARSMLIDANMPPCYWSWAMRHACFVVSQLYCIRTKNLPIIDFLSGLHQPHLEKVDLRMLPRFGCRAYKLISPKPGKFKARADKGWFLGFQQNTSKNFLILHPHITPVQGLKWAVSFTPHASFNEDIMFGHEMDPIDKQRTTSYWTNDTIATSFPTAQPNEPILTVDSSNHNPSTLNNDTPYSSGNTQSSLHSNDTPNITDPVTLDNISHNQSSQSSNHQQDSNMQHPQTPPIPSSTWIESNPSPLSSANTKPDLIETPEHDEIHTPHQICENIISPTENENEVRYDQVMTGWDPIPQIAGQKRAHSPDSNSANKNNGQDIAIRNNYEDSDNDTGIEQLQTTPHSENSPDDDLIMTGWDPIRSLAGLKRAHLPEAEFIRTKRG
ncbi:hypothetical protein K3495_g3650 [Podosphaera aphanis]|nr:hypothetical protein K3495_g3650 [Podosphaera aphanis]